MAGKTRGAGKPKLVVLSGAGISAESGLATFRDSGGLWEGYDVMTVASIDGWQRDPELVLEFYNQRRRQAWAAEPNDGHLAIAALEADYDVTVITQNVDGLHEKAGSSRVVHLHGELAKAQSSSDPNLIYPLDHWEVKLGDTCDLGSQLRPFIVFFGEPVPMMDVAIQITRSADIFIVVGTSLVVYPAAGLLDLVDDSIPTFVVDPSLPAVRRRPNMALIQEAAGRGMQRVCEQLMGPAADTQ